MLMRFDPFRELDRVAEDLWGNGNARRRVPVGIPMDAYREGDRFVVQFDLPGVAPDSFDVTVEKNVLTVSASRTIDRAEGREWQVHERPSGSFTRQLFLGETLDTDHIEAAYEHGVLTLTIPVAEAAKPRKIDVAAGSVRTPIEATAN